MLFMAIEHYNDGALERVAERFRSSGRMLPDGVVYHASWMEPSGARCFQLMETDQPELFHRWVTFWQDLVDIEIVAVQTSSEFWAARSSAKQ